MTATRKVLQRYLNKYDTDGGTPHFTPQDDSLPSRRSRQYSSPGHLSLRLPGRAESPAVCTPSLPLAYKVMDMSPPVGRQAGEKEEGFEDMEDVDFSMILKLREEREARRSERAPPVVRPGEERRDEAKPVEKSEVKEEVKPEEEKPEVKEEVKPEEEKPSEKLAEKKTEVMKEEVKPSEKPAEVKEETKPVESKPVEVKPAAPSSAENTGGTETSQNDSAHAPAEEGKKDGVPETEAKEAKESTRRRRRSHKAFTLAPPPPSSLPPTPPAQTTQPTPSPQITQPTQLPPQVTEPKPAATEPKPATEAPEKTSFPLDEQIDKVTNLLHYSTGRVNAL